MQLRCVLPSYVQWRFPVSLNDYVDVNKPGTYTVYANFTLNGGEAYTRNLTLHSNPLNVQVLP
jgi:hypothetical protein